MDKIVFAFDRELRIGALVGVLGDLMCTIRMTLILFMTLSMHKNSEFF